jgi:hypothetical protein
MLLPAKLYEKELQREIALSAIDPFINIGTIDILKLLYR